jgi:lantibiotic leader peptide-processing serine protease
VKFAQITPVVAGAVLLLSGCADELVTALTPEPILQDLQMAADAIVEAGVLTPAPARHLVVFQAGEPADFARRVEELGGTVVFSAGRANIGAVAGLQDEAAAVLEASPDIRDVVPDANIEWAGPMEAPAPASLRAPGAQANGPTAAFYYPMQWNMRAIGADAAWAAGRTGSSDVTVAIIDTGVDATHPDLVGLVDLDLSRSFVGPSETFWHTWWGAPEWADLSGHGTHVAATVSSNAERAAGVTSNVRILALKTIGLTGAPWSGLSEAIIYAADNGADVINMSLGARFPRQGNGWFIAQYLTRAVAYANRQGVTVVVSAGNDAADLDHDGNLYKAFCTTPLVICVSSTGPLEGSLSGPDAYVGGFSDFDAPSVFTNFGRSSIDVAAPGGNYTLVNNAVVSGGFVWAACSSTRFRVIDGRVFTNPCGAARIVGMAGTSMASPHVAGLAALLVETHGRNPGRISAAIHQSAEDLGPSGTDPYYGKGRINVARALGLEGRHGNARVTRN